MIWLLGRSTLVKATLGASWPDLLPVPSLDFPLEVGPLGSSSVEVAFGRKEGVGNGIGMD